jgi:hypothetical protein
LLDGLDAWDALLNSYYDENEKMKSLTGWPEMALLRGQPRKSVGLVTARWWDRLNQGDNPFAWDTGAMRAALQDELNK